MKLDRNISGDGRGKYGLIKNRRVYEIMAAGGGLSDEVQKALQILEGAGVVDWGTTQETEFFALRLKDEHAVPALAAYARSAGRVDPEYGMEVQALAGRSGTYHPFCKHPD